MLKQIFNIIKQPYSVPIRINRTRFLNQSLLNIILLFIIFTPLIIEKYLGTTIKNNDYIKPEFIIYIYLTYYSFIFLYFILYAITFWRLNIARLHDINYRALWSILLIFPFAGNILKLILSLAPGVKGSNKFGDQPKTENKPMIALAIISFITINITSVIAIIILVSAIHRIYI